MYLISASSKFVLVLLLSVLTHSQQISKTYGKRILRFPFTNAVDSHLDLDEDPQSVMKQCDDVDFADRNHLKMILAGIADDTLDQISEKRGVRRYHDSNGISTNMPITPLRPSRCSCATHSGSKYLGQGYYPRYLDTLVCNESSCVGCQKRTYFVNVLRRRKMNDDDNSSDSIQQVPDEISKNWVFEKKETIVGCECHVQQSNDKML